MEIRPSAWRERAPNLNEIKLILFNCMTNLLRGGRARRSVIACRNLIHHFCGIGFAAREKREAFFF